MQIFIIDDDPLSIFLAKTKITHADATHDFKTFFSAQEALETIKTQGLPPLILLDLNMPIMDGWKFLEALALLPIEATDSCQVYILSSSISEAELSKGAQHSLVAGFLQKPIKTEDVQKMLQF